MNKVNDIKKYIRENILELTPYSTARDECGDNLNINIFLDANENPYDNGLNRYPDPYQKELKGIVSQIKGTPEEMIFLGNGSDEAIDLIFRIFCEPRVERVVTIKPSYGMYKVAAQINCVECVEVGLDDEFNLCADKILSSVTPDTKVILLCSPNNPSGNLLSEKETIRIVETFDGIVVIDEAYIDFADRDGFLPQLDRFKNLIILQTFSKAWGLAGLRIGMAFACKEIIDCMNSVKYPYNINCASQKIAIEQLTTLREKKKSELKEIIFERKKLVEELGKISCIERIYPSDSNFILVRCSSDATDLYNYLIENEGVIVRNRSQVFGCENCLRISIGTPAENEKLIKLLKDYLTA